MANWFCLLAVVLAVFLTVPRSCAFTFNKPADSDTYEVMQNTKDTFYATTTGDFSQQKSQPGHDILFYRKPAIPQEMSAGSQSPLSGSQQHHTKQIIGVLTEHHRMEQRKTTHLMLQHDNNASDNHVRNLSDMTPPVMSFEPVKLLRSKDNRHLDTDETISMKQGGNNGRLPKLNFHYVYNSDYNQRTRHKLHEIREKSETLIKQLCSVRASKRHLCYQHGSSRCNCTGGLADCSGYPHVPNLSYAPKLPEDVKCLIFAYNNVRHLDESYFTNVSKFVVIDFSSNSLVTISTKTFGLLTNLKYLILNDNNIDYKYLRTVLDFPPSLRLDIIGLELEEVPAGYFNNYSTIPTSQIFMDFSYIINLDFREFTKLQNLKYLSLTNSTIQNVISAPMQKLKVLDLDYNSISIFPATCNGNITKQKLESDSKYTDFKMFVLSGEVSKNVSMYPVLTDLSIGYNTLLALPPPDHLCLPNLKNLYLKSNNITEIAESAFAALRSLKVLTLNKMNSGIAKIGRSAFSISTLISLYMSENNIAFGSKDISTQLFEGCSNLEVLSIDHNHLGGVSEDTFQQLLNYTPTLKYIYLGSTEIRIIPVKAFSQMRNLVKLYIYVNAIKEIPPAAFDGMLSLRYLYMDENEISSIKENAFSPETRLRLKLINLSRNEYICDCNLLWFKSWLLAAGPGQFMEYKNYMCSNFNNISVQEYVISKQACLFSKEVYILFVVCMSICIVLFLVFAILYRYRWNIRLMMYERRVPIMGDINPLDQERFRYDLFVVYCNDDCDWVIEMLIPRLEIQWKLTTCIHQRDFVAGGSIFNNIAESMNASKRILVVVSSRFALSKWCNFEMQLCQSHVITHDLPSLIVIILDEIKSRDMSAAMLALYNTTCFLKWPLSSSDTLEMDTFWKRLKKSLKCVIDTGAHDTSIKCID